MENLGTLAILLAFCFSLYSIFGSLIGKLKNKPYLIVSAERAVYSICFLLTVASGLLLYAFLINDYRLAYVASNSNSDMPVLYKLAAWWGGQAGSLLLWAWLLSVYSSIVVYMNRYRFRDMMPYITAILMVTQGFFLLLIAFVASPFEVLAVGEEIVSVADGSGLNPLLQHWAMAIHPPLLYLGYVGFIVPFAFAMGSLITRQKGDAWIHTTRRWVLLTWMFQSAGILLGAAWAYAVLGWGGYWGWDPVENASLLPWITATAFLHSVMMQEKKGMMKVWNMAMVSATFFLCLFGTFLTRSGIVSSVHAFAQSPIGMYFAIFLILHIAVTVYYILIRLDYLKSEKRLESIVSRESTFLFNNLILLASCFAILWGTLFPVISEAIMGERVSVGPPFFNRVNIPIGLFLLFLTGVGPLIAWRRSSLDGLRRAFLWPLVGGLVVAIALLAGGIRHPYALMSFGLCTFVAWTIVSEFIKGSLAIRARTGINPLAAAVELTHRNTRRYGGYVVHMGIVFMFIGFTGAAFDKKTSVEVNLGDEFSLGGYQMRIDTLNQGDNPNYSWQSAAVDVYRQGEKIDTLHPERRAFKSSGQGTSEVAIRRRLNEDLYLNFAGISNGNELVVIQAYIFPLVSWIWLGFWVLMLGSLICLVPNRIRPRDARLETAETAKTSVLVEK